MMQKRSKVGLYSIFITVILFLSGMIGLQYVQKAMSIPSVLHHGVCINSPCAHIVCYNSCVADTALAEVYLEFQALVKC